MFKITRILFSLGLALAMLTSLLPMGMITYAATTLTLNSSEDAYVNQALSTANYATATGGGTANQQKILSLNVDTAGNTRTVFLKFAKSSLDATVNGKEILSAKLKFYYSAKEADDTINLYGTSSTWAQNSITWDSGRPAIEEKINTTPIAVPSNYATVPSETAQRYLVSSDFKNSLDVTNYIRAKMLMEEDATVALQRSDSSASGTENMYISSSRYGKVTVGDQTPVLELVVQQAGTQQTPEVTWPTVSQIRYGQTFGDAISGGSASVPGRFYIEDELIKPAVNTDAGYTKKIIFAPTDTANYKTVVSEEDYTVLVDRAYQDYTFPTMPIRTSPNEKVSDLPAIPGLTWATPDQVLTLGSNQTVATYTLEGNENYYPVSDTRTVTIFEGILLAVHANKDVGLWRDPLFVNNNYNAYAGDNTYQNLRYEAGKMKDVAMNFPYTEGLATASGGTIVSAKLNFWYASSKQYALVQVFKMGTGWDETAITANTQASDYPAGTQIAPSPTATPAYITMPNNATSPTSATARTQTSIDLSTDFIQGQLNAAQDASIMMTRADTGTSASHMYISTREFVGQEPYLELIWYPNDSPPPYTVTWPTVSPITYGDKFRDALNNDGSASIAGTFSIEDADLVPDAGSYAVTITFTPTNSATPQTTTVTVTVGKADQMAPTLSVAAKISNSITITPVAGAVYGLKLKGSPNEVVYGSENTFTGLTPNTEYTAFIKLEATTNYNESAPTSIDVTTDSATPREAPDVTPNDISNTITGLDLATMEYAISIDDGANYSLYTQALDPLLGGNKKVKVRVKAQGEIPASPDTILTFTANAGDINADGIIDISDVIIASEIAVGYPDYTEEEIVRANVSDKVDMTVDICDVVMILERAVGGIISFPVELL